VTTFEKSTFSGSRVDLHAGRYLNCTFVRCELVFNGGPIHHDGSQFINCTWDFVGPAGATLSMLETLCKSDPNIAHHMGMRLGLVSEHAH